MRNVKRSRDLNETKLQEIFDNETATNFRKNIESADELEQQRLFLSNEIEDTGCHVSYR
jgi:hypothetical protein